MIVPAFAAENSRPIVSENLPVVLGLVTLGQTAQTPADPAQRHLADEPAMGWQWDSAMPSPPPGLVRPNWGLLPVESQRATPGFCLNVYVLEDAQLR